MLATCLLLPAPAAASASSAKLTDGRVTRTWKTGATGVVTTSLHSATRKWSNGQSPDFSLDLNGIATSRLRSGSGSSGCRGRGDYALTNVLAIEPAY